MVNNKKNSKRTRLELDHRRTTLLELGRKLFGKYTYDDLSISDIAKAAKISKGLLYHYFPNKRVFYVETVRVAARHILQISESTDDKEPLERLQYSLKTYLEYVEANAAAYVALLRSGVGVDPEVAAIVDDVRETFFQRIVDGLEIKSPTAHQRLILKGWIGFIEATSVEWLRNKTMSVDELCLFLQKQLGTSMMSEGMLELIKSEENQEGMAR